MNKDFDIIIGANTNKLKDDINEAISGIGSNYTVKLKAFIENEDEITRQIGRISEKLRALGSFNIPQDKNSPITKIESDLVNAKSEAKKLAETLDSAFGKTSKEADNANKKVENLIKTTQKLNAENNKTQKIVNVKGNDFYTEKTTATVKKDGNLTQDFTERNFDFKKLEKYIQDVKKDLDTWGKSVDSTGKKSKELHKILDSLQDKYRIEPQGSFAESINEAKSLHNELSKVSEEIKEQQKLAKQLKSDLSKADLSMLKKTDVNSLNRGVDKVSKNSNNMKDNDSYVFVNSVKEQNDAIREAILLNDTLKSKQNEIDRMSKQIASSVEKWKSNGVLTNEEIKKLESSFSKLSRHSDTFEKDITGISNKFKELGNKESEIIAKQKSQEEAKNLVLKESVNYEEKINKLKEEGYYHNKQMSSLESKLSSLNDGQVRDLEQVNKLLKDIESQYKKTVDYANNNKRKQDLSKEVNKQNKRVANIDESLLLTPQSKKDYKAIGKEVSNLSVDQTGKDYQDSLIKINQLYEKLLNHQQDGINKKKEEAKASKELTDLQEHLRKQEIKTAEEKNKIQRELIEQQLKAKELEEKAKKDRDKIASEMADGRSKSKNTSFESVNKKAEQEAKKLNDEQLKQYLNQQKINEEVKEFNRLKSQLKSTDFFDNSDFGKLDSMISKLSKDSTKLDKEFKEVYKELSRIGNLYDKIGSERAKIQAHLGNMEKKQIEAEAKRVNESLDSRAKLADEMGKVNEQSVQNRNKREAEMDLAQLKAIQAEQDRQYKNQVKIFEVTKSLNDELSRMSKTGSFNDKDLERVKGLISGLNKDAVDLESQIKDVNKEIRNIESINDKVKNFGNTINETRDRSLRNLERFPTELRQTEIAFDRVIERYRQLQNMDTSTPDGRNNFAREYEDLNRMLNEARTQSTDSARRASAEMNSVLSRVSHAFKQVPIWMASMGLFYGSINQVQQGFQSIFEIDKAMVGLAKVTDATNAELEEFKSSASGIGEELGVLTSDVINSTTEFQKLGYSLPQSSALAENTILYANVGDMNIKDATSYIVSTIKGFNVEVDKSGESVQRVIDIFNAVSNNYAISAEGIGQALQRSSAVLTQAGNSIEQSVALITSANTTIQDPMKVGNALKTISMRLRGVDEEGKEVVELIPELEKTFNRFGASIMENEDTFKSTYDIMNTLKQNWHKLTDIEQANVTELIGGKEQGSIVASMIANWGDALGSYETALNSAGSAQKEFEKYTQSFEYKFNSLKVALEEFWITMIDDDAVKNVVDGLTAIVEKATILVDTFGSLPSVLIPAMVALSLISKTARGFVFDKKVFDNAKTQMTEFYDISSNGTRRVTRDTEKLKKGFIGVGTAIAHMAKRMIGIIGITLAVSLAIQGIYNLITAKERETQKRIEGLEDSVSQFEQMKEKMESLNVDEYLYLDDKKQSGNLDTKELEKYNELQKTIISEMPELVKGYTQQGEAIIRTSDEIRELIKEKERLYSLDKQSLAEENIKGMDSKSLEHEIEATKTLMNQSNFSKEEGDAYRFLRKWMETNKEDLAIGSRELDDEINKLYKDLDNIISDDNTNKTSIINNMMDFTIQAQNTNSIDNVMKQLDSQIKKVSIRTSKLADEVDKSRQEAEKSLNDYSTLISDLMVGMINEKAIDVKSGEFLFINEMRDSMIEELFQLGEDVDVEAHALKIPERIKAIIEHAEKNNININKMFDFTMDAGSIEKEFDKFIESINDSDANAEVLIETLTRLRDEATKTSESLAETKTIDVDTGAVLDSYIKEVTDLDTAYRTLTEGKKLTNQEVVNLINKYPELNKSLTTQNGYLKLNKDAIKNVADELKNKSAVQLQEARRSVEIAKQEAEGNIKAIYQNMVAIDQLNKMRREEAVSKAYEINRAKYANMSYAQAVKEGSTMESDIGQYYDAVDELKEIDNALNSLNSFSLGNITADPNKTEKKKKDKKQELQDAIYVADEYALRMERINNLMSIEQSKRERLSIASAQYNKSVREELALADKKKKAMAEEIKSLEKQINTKNIQQKGLISLGQKDNKTARAKSAELAQELDKLRGDLGKLKVEYEQVINDSYELQWSLVEGNRHAYELQRESLTDDIAYMEHMKSMYDENSDAFKKYSNEKINMLMKNEDSYKKELAYLEKVRNTSKNLNKSQIEELNFAIREARERLYDATSEIKDELKALQEIEIEFKFKAYSEGMEEFNDAVFDVQEKLSSIDENDWSGQIQAQEDLASVFRGQVGYINDVISGLQKLRSEHSNNHELVSMIDSEIKSWKNELKNTKKELNSAINDIKKTYEKIADETVEIHKAGLQAQLDAEKNAYDDMEDMYKRAHEKKMKQYEKELDILSDIYDKQIEMINREDATRTYDKSLESLQKEASKLQKQLDILKLDDSYESIKKQKELQEQLDTKNEEITELKYEREKDLRIESLEDAKESELEKLEDKKDKLEEEHDEFMNSLKKEHEAKKRHLEQMLNDERYFAELRKSVMEGSLDEIAKLMEEWETTVGSHVTSLGDTVVGNFTMKVKEAIKEFEKMNKIAKNTTNNVTSPKDALEKAQSGVNQDKDSWYKPSTGGSSGGSTGGSGGSSSSSGGSSNAGSYTSYPTPKTVKVIYDVGLFKDLDKKQKLKSLKVGETYKAVGEQKSMYDLGGGFSAKGNFKVVSSSNSSGSSSNGSSSGRSASNSQRYHTVKSGDTMSDLAQKYYGSSSSWSKIKNANPSVNPNKMQIGTKLLIPFRDGGYTGDWSGDEGRIALLHKKENILNEEQTLHIFNAVKSIEDAKRISVSNNFGINKEKEKTVQEVKHEYNLTVEVENLYSDKKQLDIVSEQIMDNIKRTRGRGVE